MYRLTLCLCLAAATTAQADSHILTRPSLGTTIDPGQLTLGTRVPAERLRLQDPATIVQAPVVTTDRLAPGAADSARQIERAQTLIQTDRPGAFTWYEAPAADLTIARPTERIQLNDLETGALIPFESLSASQLSPQYLNGLAQGGVNAIDLNDLGVTQTPDLPVNPFALYKPDGSFGGIVTPPPGVSSQAFMRLWADKGQPVVPVVAMQGDSDVSTLTHKILAVLVDICAVSIRPVELTVQASGGWDFGWEAKAQISAKIDVDKSCQLLAEDLAAAQSEADDATD